MYGGSAFGETREDSCLLWSARPTAHERLAGFLGDNLGGYVFRTMPGTSRNSHGSGMARFLVKVNIKARRGGAPRDLTRFCPRETRDPGAPGGRRWGGRLSLCRTRPVLDDTVHQHNDLILGQDKGFFPEGAPPASSTWLLVGAWLKHLLLPRAVLPPDHLAAPSSPSSSPHTRHAPAAWRPGESINSPKRRLPHCRPSASPGAACTGEALHKQVLKAE